MEKMRLEAPTLGSKLNSSALYTGDMRRVDPDSSSRFYLSLNKYTEYPRRYFIVPLCCVCFETCPKVKGIRQSVLTMVGQGAQEEKRGDSTKLTLI